MDPHVSRSKLKDGKTKVTVKRQLFPNILWKAKSKIKSVKIRECGYERSVKRANSMNHEISRTRSRDSDAFATHFQRLREASIHVAKKAVVTRKVYETYLVRTRQLSWQREDHRHVGFRR
ncbi:MAG: hypothetical protein IM509_10530 [Microcystis sp. M31BS1]|jgi:hypothetical protein|nr:hypothetical protein [Microcystis sp. M53598_WE2]MCA2591145.1 hypothetical protein [Microcystis sp. M31BS1]